MKTRLPSVWQITGLAIALMALVMVPSSSAQNSIADLVSANSAANLLSNGGFETMKPAYWEPSASGADWSGEQARTPGRSLKLSESGSDWVQAEAVRAWVGGLPGWMNPQIVVGGWVYTDGVNT